MRFFAATIQPGTGDIIPLDNGEEHGLDPQLAADAVYNLSRVPFDINPDGYTARLTENLNVAGEAWVHIDADDQWAVRSTSEVSASADGRVTIVSTPNATAATTRILDPANEDLLRMWIPDPEYGALADAPLRSMLGTAEDVILAERESQAAARSRAAANGILLLPDSLSLARTRDGGDDEEWQDDSVMSDSFMADFAAAMIAPIQDEGSAQAVIPIVMRGSHDDLDKVRHLTLQRADAEQLIARQRAALTRLVNGSDVQPEQLEGTGNMNHWCVDHETEALTTRGWVTHDQLATGDVVLTLNHDTGLSEWQPVQDIYRAEVVNEPMVLMHGRGHSSLTTPEHRWPTHRTRRRGGVSFTAREFRFTRDLGEYDRITTGAACVDQPVIPKYADDVVELVGWFWTEGNINQTGVAVSISQSHTRNPDRVDRIRAALTRLYGPARPALPASLTEPAWREKLQLNTSSFGGPITVFYLNRAASTPLLEAAPGKFVTADWVQALTAAQLELFIQVSCMGDGWHYRSGHLDIWQRDPRALDGYELALVLSGRPATRTTSGGGTVVHGGRRATVRPIKSHKATMAGRSANGMVVSDVRYTGVVWCPVTPNSTWFARRQGRSFYTGNSSWNVDARAVREQAGPMAETIAACHAAAFLRPALLSLNHPPDQVRRIVIGTDKSALVENPNRGQDAVDVHTAGALSDAALRKYKGFDEDDAPTKQEMILRMARDGRFPAADASQIFGLSEAGVQREHITVQGQVTNTAQPALPTGSGDSPGATSGGTGTRPAAVPGDLHPAQATPTAPVVESPNPPASPTVQASAIRASATPEVDPAADWVVHDEPAQRLAAIDSTLVDRILGAADAALHRTLERAGAKVRSGVRNVESLRAKIRDLDPVLIPSRLGRGEVEKVGVPAELVADEWPRLRGQVTTWIDGAVSQAGQAAAGVLGYASGSLDARGVARELRDRLHDDSTPADRAWTVLADAMRARAVEALFDPSPVDPDDDTRLLPAQAVIDALTVAGGAELSPVDGEDSTLTAAVGGARRQRRTNPGLLAAGPWTLDMILARGGMQLGWQWHTNPHLIRDHLPGHLALEGVSFTAWDADVLRSRDEWIGDFYSPGDHRGCRCLAAPRVAAPRNPRSGLARALGLAGGDPERITGRDAAELRDRANAALDAMRAEHIRPRRSRR